MAEGFLTEQYTHGSSEYFALVKKARFSFHCPRIIGSIPFLLEPEVNAVTTNLHCLYRDKLEVNAVTTNLHCLYRDKLAKNFHPNKYAS